MTGSVCSNESVCVRERRVHVDGVFTTAPYSRPRGNGNQVWRVKFYWSSAAVASHADASYKAVGGDASEVDRVFPHIEGDTSVQCGRSEQCQPEGIIARYGKMIAVVQGGWEILSEPQAKFHMPPLSITKDSNYIDKESILYRACRGSLEILPTAHTQWPPVLLFAVEHDLMMSEMNDHRRVVIE